MLPLRKRLVLLRFDFILLVVPPGLTHSFHAPFMCMNYNNDGFLLAWIINVFALVKVLSLQNSYWKGNIIKKIRISFGGKNVSRKTQPSTFLLLWKRWDLSQLPTKSVRIQLVHDISCALHRNRYNYSKKYPAGKCTSWGEECDLVVKALDWASPSLGFISGLTTVSFRGFVDKLLDLPVLQFFIWSTDSTSIPHGLGV